MHCAAESQYIFYNLHLTPYNNNLFLQAKLYRTNYHLNIRFFRIRRLLNRRLQRLNLVFFAGWCLGWHEMDTNLVEIIWDVKNATGDIIVLCGYKSDPVYRCVALHMIYGSIIIPRTTVVCNNISTFSIS